MSLRLLAPVLAALAAFTAGWLVHGWKSDSEALALERGARAGAEAAGDRITAALAKVRPVYTTINRRVEHETRIEPRYTDPGCFHSDAVWLQISAAYEALGYPALDRGGLPEAPAAPSR